MEGEVFDRLCDSVNLIAEFNVLYGGDISWEVVVDDERGSDLHAPLLTRR